MSQLQCWQMHTWQGVHSLTHVLDSRLWSRASRPVLHPKTHPLPVSSSELTYCFDDLNFRGNSSCILTTPGFHGYLMPLTMVHATHD